MNKIEMKFICPLADVRWHTELQRVMGMPPKTKGWTQKLGNNIF